MHRVIITVPLREVNGEDVDYQTYVHASTKAKHAVLDLTGNVETDRHGTAELDFGIVSNGLAYDICTITDSIARDFPRLKEIALDLGYELGVSHAQVYAYPITHLEIIHCAP